MASPRLKVTLAALVILIVLCGVFRKPFLRATMPEVKNIELSEFALINDSAFVKLSLIVMNKGVWHIDLKHVRLGIYDDTLKILSYESDTLKTFDRNEIRKEELYCKLPFREVVQRIREHQGEDTVGLHLKGELVYSTFLGESTSFVDKIIPVNVPVPPRLFVRGIDYTGKSDGLHNFLFHLVLKNDNPRKMELENLSYELQGGQSIDLHGNLENVSIAALDSSQISVPAAISITDQFALISNIILDRDEMPYRFVMKGTIESFTGIVEEDVPITVCTYGKMELYNETDRNRPKIRFSRKKR